ncbi:hypothetical protein M8J77_001074 [Diaphorina citri]|nr:hypothetical protein M8J77_001074 [Diaphorina citri]
MHNSNPKYPFFLIKFSPLTTFQEEDSPKCANCQGDHLSNNRKCTAYKTYIDKIGKLKNKSKPSLRQETLDAVRRPPDPGDLSLFPALPTDYSQPRWGPRGGGYPDPVLTPALQPGLPPLQRTEDLTGTERRRVSGEHATGIGDLQELIELMKELQLICDLKSLIEKVKKLIPKLREAKTDLERIQACLDLANLDD